MNNSFKKEKGKIFLMNILMDKSIFYYTNQRTIFCLIKKLYNNIHKCKCFFPKYALQTSGKHLKKYLSRNPTSVVALTLRALQCWVRTILQCHRYQQSYHPFIIACNSCAVPNQKPHSRIIIRVHSRIPLLRVSIASFLPVSDQTSIYSTVSDSSRGGRTAFYAGHGQAIAPI